MSLQKQDCYIAQRNEHMAETKKISDLAEELIVKRLIFTGVWNLPD